MREAGATDEKAREAAEAVASYDRQLAALQSDVGLVKWMVGFNLAFSVALLWKAFS